MKPGASVLSPRIRPSAPTTRVLTAPIFSARGVSASARRKAASLCGMVTLPPANPPRGGRARNPRTLRAPRRCARRCRRSRARQPVPVDQGRARMGDRVADHEGSRHALHLPSRPAATRVTPAPPAHAAQPCATRQGGPPASSICSVAWAMPKWRAAPTPPRRGSGCPDGPAPSPDGRSARSRWCSSARYGDRAGRATPGRSRR